MQRWLAAQEAHQAREVFQRLEGTSEGVNINEEWFLVVAAEARAVGAAVGADVGDLDLDVLVLVDRLHVLIVTSCRLTADAPIVGVV
jgi:hypothetical protein